jgi:hypothetical protein
MSDYITLLGAEDVTRAASSMRSSAEDMLRAASIISESNQRLITELTELTTRCEVAIECALDHLRASIQEKPGG